MNADRAVAQRIGRLTPLADVLATISPVAPVAAREVALSQTAGHVLAADVVACAAMPAMPVALRDGWAVASEATRDAGPYAPMLLNPPPERVDAFEPLPPGTDAVAPLDAVTAIGGMMQIMVPVAPGEDVLPPSGDARAGTTLYAAGKQLRATDVAALAALGEVRVSVRVPQLQIINTRPGDAALEAATQFIADAVRSAGGRAATDQTGDLDAALRNEKLDAVLCIGGTGTGRNDRSVIALSRAGHVTCHGIGLLPGDTAAFGHVGSRPVLLIPGRIDAALACWLTLGRKLIDRLSGATGDVYIATTARLSRKVTSTIGMAEVIPVRCAGGQAEALASGYLSLQSLARADGWIFVPAESEGYPAGTDIQVRPLP